MSYGRWESFEKKSNESREDSITVTTLRCSGQFTVCLRYSDPDHTVKDGSVVFYFLPIRSALNSTLENAIMYDADCYYMYDANCLPYVTFPVIHFFHVMKL